MQVTITVQNVLGHRCTFDVSANPQVDELVEAIQRAGVCGPVPTGSKLVHKGVSYSTMQSTQRLPLKQGDLVLIVPQRKAPTASIQARGGTSASSPAADSSDSEPPSPLLPDSAPAWHRKLAAALTQRGCPDLVLEWLFIIGPGRLLGLIMFLALAPLMGRLGLGPVWVLGAILVAIFTNLGKRRAGEASAYSIFNEGVERLPGQLDADVIDQQIRQGRMQ